MYVCLFVWVVNFSHLVNIHHLKALNTIGCHVPNVEMFYLNTDNSKLRGSVIKITLNALLLISDCASCVIYICYCNISDLMHCFNDTKFCKLCDLRHVRKQELQFC